MESYPGSTISERERIPFLGDGISGIRAADLPPLPGIVSAIAVLGTAKVERRQRR
jgi:hypothetical protein